MIKIGLLGFGFMGNQHFRIYENLPEAKVVGAWDLDPEKLKSGKITAGNIGDSDQALDLSKVKIYTNPEEIIKSKDIDLVDICLPTYLHTKYTVLAFESGKHVFCEKPMALTVEDCDKMLDSAKKANKKFMIGQCVRFWPEYVLTKKIIEEKKYGKVISAFFRRVSPIPGWSCQSWLMDETKSGGALLDLHIHDTDYVFYLFGKPEQVMSFGKKDISNPQSGIEYVITRYVYNEHPLVIAEGGWHFHPTFPFNMSFTIRCEKATIVFDMAQEKTLSIHKSDNTVEYPEVSKNTGWDEELKYFVDCVAQNKEITISPAEESKTAVEIALVEKKSVEKNQPSYL